MQAVIQKNDKKNYREILKNKKYILQFLPSSLEEYSKVKIIDWKGKKIKTSYIIDIVHCLLLKYYIKKKNNFNLSSLILKEKYGMNYNYYIDFLITNNHLVLLKKHQKGKNSRIYRFGDSIIKSDIRRYRNTDTFILKKYKMSMSEFDNQSKNNSILTEVKEKLIEDLFHVEIDTLSALTHLDTFTKDKESYNKNSWSIECINDQHIFYHFDDFGRMHSNFTILKSNLRKNCLLIDGEKTCEIDIPNSQPLFLCKLIFEENILLVDEKEFNLFKSLTLSGKFYKYMMDKASEPIDKKGVKEIVYKVLFGRNYKTKADLLFEKLFPTIYKFLKSYKREHLDYRKVAHHLQNAESNLIFNKIIKKIMSIYPEIRVITVHDSIIVPCKYKIVVEAVFNQLLSDEFEYIG